MTIEYLILKDQADGVNKLLFTVGEMLNVRRLEAIHEIISPEDVVTRANDSYTNWHQLFYRHIENESRLGKRFLGEYNLFVNKLCSKVFVEDFVYQAIPTVRFHMPDNKAVGEYHRDADYGHSFQEINFWVPLTEAKDSSAVYLVDMNDTDRSHGVELNCNYGDVLVFDGANRLHGNSINKTGLTRVSFDFRVILSRNYKGSINESVNSKKKFIVGDYFKEGL